MRAVGNIGLVANSVNTRIYNYNINVYKVAENLQLPCKWCKKIIELKKNIFKKSNNLCFIHQTVKRGCRSKSPPPPRLDCSDGGCHEPTTQVCMHLTWNTHTHWWASITITWCCVITQLSLWLWVWPYVSPISDLVVTVDFQKDKMQLQTVRRSLCFSPFLLSLTNKFN